MYRDVLGAAIFARDVLGWSRVACIGVSNGAAVSLLAAALDDGITYSTRTGEQGDASTGEKAGQGAHRPDPDPNPTPTPAPAPTPPHPTHPHPLPLSPLFSLPSMPVGADGDAAHRCRGGREPVPQPGGRDAGHPDGVPPTHAAVAQVLYAPAVGRADHRAPRGPPDQQPGAREAHRRRGRHRPRAAAAGLPHPRHPRQPLPPGPLDPPLRAAQERCERCGFTQKNAGPAGPADHAEERGSWACCYKRACPLRGRVGAGPGRMGSSCGAGCLWCGAGVSLTELWIVPGACHTEVYDRDKMDFSRRVLSFLERHL